MTKTRKTTNTKERPQYLAAREDYHSLVPSQNDYEFDKDVFDGEFGDACFDTPEGNPRMFTQPIMKEVRVLEAAKHRAVQVITDLSVDAASVQEAQAAEREVICARLEVIESFIHEGEPLQPICHAVKLGGVSPNVSVQYRRLRWDDTRKELFPVQGTVAWPASELQWEELSLLSQHVPNQDDTPLSPQLQGLLQRMVAHAVSSCNTDQSTLNLRELYWKHEYLKTNLNFSCMHTKKDEEHKKLLSAIWQLPDTLHDHSVVYKATVKSKDPREDPGVTVHVLWGTMLINHCDEWHNPLINAYVRNAVRTTGKDAIERMHEASQQRDQQPEHMLNILRPVIRVLHGNQVHVLTLAPFLKPDMCSVQHLFVLDDDNTKGILGMVDKEITQVPRNILCLPSPLKHYYCVGTRPGARFNEQELNYLHTEALLWQSEDGRVVSVLTDLTGDGGSLGPSDVPESKQKRREHKNRTLSFEKSTRISFQDWDVIVSSFDHSQGRHPKQPKTVISLFNYPPSGIRYIKDPIKTVFMPGDLLDPENGRRGPFRHPRIIYKPGKSGLPVFAGGNSTRDKRKGHYRSTLTFDPATPFFVTWFYHDPHQNLISKHDVYLIEDSDKTGTVTARFRTLLSSIRTQISNRFTDHWVQGAGFEETLIQNETRVMGETPMEVYRHAWAHVLVEFIMRAYNAEDNSFSPEANAYLYIRDNAVQAGSPRDQTVWQDIFAASKVREADKSMYERWAKYSEQRREEDTLPRKFIGPNSRNTGVNADAGAAAASRRSERLAIAPGGGGYFNIQQMLTRIRCLEEAALNAARQSENQKHLMLMSQPAAPHTAPSRR